VSTTPPSAESLHHHSRPMGGRDRHEAHRVATPLELLFDLSFVISFGLAASQLAHALAEGHYASGLLGFGFASFAICWAWINFSWFASAYDTDDWIFRIVTMVQMIGVLVLAIGLPRTGLTFGMWWVYYVLPSAPVLQAHRHRAFVWGYGQMLIVTAIVATGAGLHVAAYFIEHKATISPLAAVLTVAVPVSGFLGLIYVLYYYLVRRFDSFHLTLLGATAGVVVGAVVAALSGISMAACLVILMFAPAVTVVGYEMRGYRHQAAALLN
jgi:low temperature requirement protein LtrA